MYIFWVDAASIIRYHNLDTRRQLLPRNTNCCTTFCMVKRIFHNIVDCLIQPITITKKRKMIRARQDEKRLIDEKMSQLPTRRYGAYLRKMAIDGYIIYTDTADIKAFTKELSAIGRNINQIAKRINAGGHAYQADMDEIRERLDEIWQLQRRILSSQR